jgi:opacity protein-like surface antigen
MLRRSRTRVPLIIVFAAVLMGCASQASAQPFIPAPGEGTVSMAYHWVATFGQLDNFGTQLAERGGPREGTDSHVALLYVEYGVSDRIAVHASLPYMQLRYQGSVPHTIGIKGQPSNLDDGTYHGTFQDFYFGTRFKLSESARFAVTPFVEGIIPSHHYESLGQAVVGRDLRALVVGTAIGGFADYLIPGLHFQTRLSYALVQKAVDIRPNRTGIDSAVGYFVTPRLGIEFIETFQYTHNGIDWNVPPDFLGLHDGRSLNRDYGLNHDRLARSNALTLGGGASFALTEKFGLFGTVAKLAWGENLPAPRSVTVGMNWGFQTRRSASRRRPNVNRPVALQ